MLAVLLLLLLAAALGADARRGRSISSYGLDATFPIDLHYLQCVYNAQFALVTRDRHLPHTTPFFERFVDLDRRPTHGVDVVPTVLDALGLSANDPTLSGYVLGAAPDDRPRFGMSVARAGVLQSVTRDDRKLIFDWDGHVTAFDRRRDRYEAEDVFDAGSAQDRALWDLLLPHVVAMRDLQPDEAFVWPTGLPHP